MCEHCQSSAHCSCLSEAGFYVFSSDHFCFFSTPNPFSECFFSVTTPVSIFRSEPLPVLIRLTTVYLRLIRCLLAFLVTQLSDAADRLMLTRLTSRGKQCVTGVWRIKMTSGVLCSGVSLQSDLMGICSYLC